MNLLERVRRHRDANGLLVCEGQVNCWKAGRDVDVEVCLSCPLLKSASTDQQGRTRIQCRRLWSVDANGSWLA